MLQHFLFPEEMLCRRFARILNFFSPIVGETTLSHIALPPSCQSSKKLHVKSRKQKNVFFHNAFHDDIVSHFQNYVNTFQKNMLVIA